MDEAKSTGSFFSELRRRKVIRTCLLYILVCWGALQVFDIVAPALGFDADLVSRYFLYVAVLGFPVNFALAWFYQISSSGIVRTQSFIERRVLDNIPPINDKRKQGVSSFLRKGEEDASVHWVISAETGPLSGLSYAVYGPITLGRALDCDLAVVTPHVSRQHARIGVQDDRLYIEDLGSSNGTMVNGKRTSGRQQLRHDDELRFHDIIFRVTENLSRPLSERQASDQTTFIHAAELDKQG
ncbi:FHA domain-containing protein [Seongchinamella sediminis]|uniref:FHA domain-containing protein n=1 Tax=Seongchinamella sediminis TaxID=2283635 RepID=A0A3L7DYV6_9GAMM|nr:FHA domain-containing protein [Seongchinamella sediminis]RLQ22396.1 FHA domain-containing protein [Seongchinamella sediminis]